MANNFMRFDFVRAVWKNSTDGGTSFSDAGWCFLSGTLANRPAAGAADRLYITTDTREVFYDDGAVWILVASENLLQDSDLAANGGSVVENDRQNNFTSNQRFSGYGTQSISANVSAEFDDHIGFNGVGGGTPVIRIFDINSLRIYDGSNHTWFHTAGGIEVGSPTGSDQGAGTLNAEAVYDDGTLLTDYVFDAELDGIIDTAKWDANVPNREHEDDEGNVTVEERIHEPARGFDLNELDPATFAGKTNQTRKLPAIDRLEKRITTDKPGLGESIQALVETCEVQAVHIQRQQDEIEALKARLDKLEQ